LIINSHEVNVIWQGDKANHLPTGLQYITVAKFDESWIDEAWSIVLNFEIPPSQQGNPSKGYAKFLMPNAPLDKLFSGQLFQLYEGNVLVAKVEVI
jgi:hypothetical protein